MQFSDEGQDKGHQGVIDLGNIEEKEWVQNIAKEEGMKNPYRCICQI